MKELKWDPGFQDAGSRLYRAEYAGVFLAVLGYLVWRGIQSTGTEAFYFRSSLVFRAIFPNLTTLVPIGLASKQGPWPKWGPRLYNTIHTVLVWSILFGLSWLALRVPS